MPPQLISMMNRPTPMTTKRTHPADEPRESDGNERDEYHDVHEFKRCMDAIRTEHPDLSTGALQRMALQRMREQNSGQCKDKRSSEPGHLLRGVMSKFRIGSKSSDCGAAASAPCEDEICSTVGSSGRRSSAGSNPGSRVRHQRSLAVRASVNSVSSDEGRRVSQSVDLSEGENDEESLQDSLENIERGNVVVCESKPSGAGCANRMPGRVKDSRRYSRRISGLSLDLSDVDEDEESRASNDGGKREKERDLGGSSLGTFGLSSSSGLKANFDKGRRAHRRGLPATRRESASDILPDEIKLVLDDFGGKDGCRDTRGENSGRLQKSVHDSSLLSSFLSVDSANFDGDFSAWASNRSIGKSA